MGAVGHPGRQQSAGPGPGKGRDNKMTLTLTLRGALRHADAPALTQELADALAQDDLTIETAELTQLTCGIVQVIAAAQVTARVLDRNLQAEVAADTPFATALDRLGVHL